MSDDQKRHCSFCHKCMAPSEAKKCGKCHRRLYCGRECQVEDWKSKRTVAGTGDGAVGLGQGHKDWCGLNVLEEDVDWELVNIEGKNKALVAKTIIPPLTRIVVDGTKQKDAEFQNTITTMISGLQLSEENLDELRAMFLELPDESRAMFLNHACDANANRMIDQDYQTHIIYSKREIQPGEEICVNYTYFTESHFVMPNPYCNMPGAPTLIDSAANSRHILKAMFNIVCPSDCFCYQKGLDEKVEEWKGTFAAIETDEECLAQRSKAICIFEHGLDMERVELTLKGNEDLNGNPITKARILERAFGVAARNSETLDQASQWIKECAGIWKAVTHPKSKTPLKAKVDAYLREPSSYQGYLCIDKKWEGTNFKASEDISALLKHIQQKHSYYDLNNLNDYLDWNSLL